MKQKIFSAIIFTILTIILAIFFWNEYQKFQKEKTELEKQNNEIIELAKNFSLEKINFLENTEVFYTPYPKLLTDFTDKIDNAKNEIFFEVYMFTEKRILQSLINAKKRWVTVKVILEKNPYKSENANNKNFEELKKNWVEVVWSNTKNYYLNHSKFFIIDDLTIISTWNLTYSTFTENRDFLVFSYDKNILEKLKQTFLNDFSWKKLDVYDENLVVSPNFSRIKLEKMISESQKNIKIYIQYLNDKSLNNLLVKAKKERNIEIEIIIDQKNFDAENTNFLKNNWIKIIPFNWKTMHSKVILIDEKYLFIGSENFSDYSLDKNREMWILLRDEKNISKVLEIFKKDSKN